MFRFISCVCIAGSSLCIGQGSPLGLSTDEKADHVDDDGEEDEEEEEGEEEEEVDEAGGEDDEDIEDEEEEEEGPVVHSDDH